MIPFNFSIRLLKTAAEFAACAALQREIWGLSEADSMSTVTLHALAMDHPQPGLLLGAFADDEMVGLAVAFAAFEPQTAYGHMLGVKPAYRDSGLGHQLMQDLHNRLKMMGIKFFYYTFDPLESRNSHLYLNRHGAVGVTFKPDAYAVSGLMHGGLPMDRFLAVEDLASPPPPPPPALETVLAQCPIATPDDMPEVEAVLIEIPADIARLREQAPAAALAASQTARILFSEYMNRRGLVSHALVRGQVQGQPRSFHLLGRRTGTTP